MPVARLAIANPSANLDTTLYTADKAYVVAVIAANKGSNPTLVDIAVVPSGESLTTAGYVVKNISIAGGQSFETFKFALNSGDSIRVAANTAFVSYVV